jgi:hypothetical protein
MSRADFLVDSVGQAWAERTARRHIRDFRSGQLSLDGVAGYVGWVRRVRSRSLRLLAQEIIRNLTEDERRTIDDLLLLRELGRDG